MAAKVVAVRLVDGSEAVYAAVVGSTTRFLIFIRRLGSTCPPVPAVIIVGVISRVIRLGIYGGTPNLLSI